MLRELAPISEGYLRQLLHEAEVEIEQPYEGVRTSSLDRLEASLVEMEHVYSAALAAGDHARVAVCRKVVIQAKDRARKRSGKEEMVAWMLVWLENPAVFPAWVEARKRVIAAELTRRVESH